MRLPPCLRLASYVAIAGPRLGTKCVGFTLFRQLFQLLVIGHFRGALKVLMYDAQGFWLCHKRLSAGKFKHWPRVDQSILVVSTTQLQVLLSNGNPFAIDTTPDWRPI